MKAFFILPLFISMVFGANEAPEESTKLLSQFKDGIILEHSPTNFDLTPKI